ncbi:MAG TPA: diaminopimelate decarboxylase [Mogibacterium sp.]|nr:diaminopimelate decarboxylase [Mogibacterium sp.]
MIEKNITVKDGTLYFAGQNTLELAEKYGTPLYLLDEDLIRENCRTYKNAVKKYFPEGSEALYASKANSFKRIYEIMTEEGIGVDVASSGEIYTALKSGYDLSQAYFNSNNKTEEDVKYAIENGIGYFVVDNKEEIDMIQEEAERQDLKQKVFLRLTPGVDPHTYEAISTGKVDSKFGSAIETGQAEEITKYTLTKENVILSGFHCHVGSQVFEEDVFEKCAVVMLNFISLIEKSYGHKTEILDLGGGYGVRYTEEDGYLDIEEKIKSVGDTVKSTCEELGITPPKVYLEPGRSIVGNAGMTLYTVGSVKIIPEYKNYVSVDGGMTDNPRFALYGARYTVLLANKMDEEKDFVASVVGRLCESGDKIQENVSLPSSVCKGDILAVCTTGAYNYSMASNYNRLQRPPIVMLKNKTESYIAVKRESLEDIVRNDV